MTAVVGTGPGQSRRAPAVGPALDFTLHVIDVQPRLRLDEAGEAAVQCAACTLVSFLRGVPSLAGCWALGEVRAFFAALPRLWTFWTRGAMRELGEAARGLGAREVYQLVEAGERGRPGLARVRVVEHDRADQLAGPGGADCLLVVPGPGGPAAALRALRAARRRGHERLLFGFPEHARAVDGWAHFCDRPTFDFDWLELLRGLEGDGLAPPGLVMAYPPCALLQRPVNRPLESLRARMDLQLRRLDQESSLMCPENVSGYSLVNDLRDVSHLVRARRDRFAIRMDHLLLFF